MKEGKKFARKVLNFRPFYSVIWGEKTPELSKILPFSKAFQGLRGKAGKEVCSETQTSPGDLRLCKRVSLDRVKSAAEYPRYIQMNGLGLHRFGSEYTQDRVRFQSDR